MRAGTPPKPLVLFSDKAYRKGHFLARTESCAVLRETMQHLRNECVCANAEDRSAGVTRRSSSSPERLSALRSIGGVLKNRAKTRRKPAGRCIGPDRVAASFEA